MRNALRENGPDVQDGGAGDGGQLHDLARLVFQSFQRLLEHRTMVHDVSASQWSFLRQLWRTDGICQRELANRLGISEATATIALRRLEEKGFVSRRRNAGNRREMLVFPTRRTQALEAVLIPLARDVHVLATQDFTAAEVATLERLLRSVIVNLAAA